MTPADVFSSAPLVEEGRLVCTCMDAVEEEGAGCVVPDMLDTKAGLITSYKKRHEGEG